MGKENTPEEAIIDRHVGNRVRVRRVVLRMSQDALAKRMALTFQQIQKYEKGVNRIGASRLYGIARALGVTVEFFFEGLAKPGDDASDEARAAADEATNEMDGFLATTDGLKLARAYGAIPRKDVRERFLKLGQALAGEK